MERPDQASNFSVPVNRGRFTREFLDRIRDRVPLADIVSPHVALKRAGREFKALSPFKTERTPSFTVVPAKGFYHCFSSGEHGDVIDFVMKVEGLSFPEAVEKLAARAGIDIPQSGHGDVKSFGPATTSRKPTVEANRRRDIAVTIWATSARAKTDPISRNMSARGAWPPDVQLPGCVRWLPLELARQIGYPLPAGAAGAAIYAFGRSAKVTGVQVEPMTRDGLNVPWMMANGKVTKRLSRGDMRGSGAPGELAEGRGCKSPGTKE